MTVPLGIFLVPGDREGEGGEGRGERKGGKGRRGGEGREEGREGKGRGERILLQNSLGVSMSV